MIEVRNYKTTDYEAIKKLYLDGDLYGGQFDEARDSADKLETITTTDPQSILVCVQGSDILGTISLIENPRVAWLYRFATKREDAAKALYDAACTILKSRGHTQVLVYSPLDHPNLDQRYSTLGLNKGSPYTCFWKTLE